MDATPEAERQNPFARAIQAVIAFALRRRAVRAALLYVERRGPVLADSITYRALFSVFAAVLLGFSVAGLWLAGNPEAFRALVAAVDSAIPGLVGPDGIVDAEAITAPTGLTLTGIASLVALVGAALGAIGALRTALRSLAGTVGDDVFWLWVILRNLALAIGIALAVAVTAFLTVTGGSGIRALTGALGAEDSPAAVWAERALDILIILVMDTLLVAALFVVLSGVRASARALWSGALLGGLGLLVLQQLSGLFIGGARANPLLASFAALIALLIWLNLSAQVVLYAGAFIITAVEDQEDTSAGRARTFEERRLERAERMLRAAHEERDAASAAVRKAEPSADAAVTAKGRSRSAAGTRPT